MEYIDSLDPRKKHIPRKMIFFIIFLAIMGFIFSFLLYDTIMGGKPIKNLEGSLASLKTNQNIATPIEKPKAPVKDIEKEYVNDKVSTVASTIKDRLNSLGGGGSSDLVIAPPEVIDEYKDKWIQDQGVVTTLVSTNYEGMRVSLASNDALLYFLPEYRESVIKLEVGQVIHFEGRIDSYQGGLLILRETKLIS